MRMRGNGKLGAAIREARLRRNWTQQGLARDANASDSWLSDVELGKRRASPDMVKPIARALDDPRVYLAAADDVTDGVMTTPWLDGDRVDLHRASVRLKAEEELREALEALRQADVTNLPAAADAEAIAEALLQALDARVAIDHYVAVICREYGLSPRELCKEHRAKLKARGYIRAERR